jgi:SAM-dependent methyltransferase
MEAELTPPPDPTRDDRLRRDLGRIHRAMGSATLVRRAIDRLGLATPPRRLLDLGAGDGTLLLRVARAMPPSWKGVEITLLDLHDVVSDRTRKAFASLGWQTRIEKVDVIDWANAAHPGGYDLCLSVLFLHRLEKDARAHLLPALARRTMAFVACEPRRSTLARAGSHVVQLLGSSATMRDDAVAGVAAGFSGRELSGAWPPAPGAWALDEYASGLFMHCFSAVRVAARAMDHRGLGRWTSAMLASNAVLASGPADHRGPRR